MSDSDKQAVKISGNNNTVENSITHNHADKKPRLLLRITEFDARINKLPEALRHKQMAILIVESVIEDEIDAIGAEKLASTLTDLAEGNFSKTDKVFAEIEEHEKPAGKRGARIAFARAKIAEQQMRWRDVTEHYSYSALAYPCFETLIAAQDFCIKAGDYDSALAFSAKAKTVVSADYGDTSEKYAAILCNLASIYRDLEKYKKAEAIYIQVLDICEYHVETESYLVANALNKLGEIYCLQGQYKKAESYFSQSLEIRQNELGENHPDIAPTLNNLAGLYKMRDEFDKAELFFSQALKIFETNFGLDHPNTKIVKANHEEIKKQIAKKT